MTVTFNLWHKNVGLDHAPLTCSTSILTAKS